MSPFVKQTPLKTLFDVRPCLKHKGTCILHWVMSHTKIHKKPRLGNKDFINWDLKYITTINMESLV